MLICRLCSTGLASDVVIEVGEISFHLHKVNFIWPAFKFWRYSVFVKINSSFVDWPHV